MNNLLAWNDSLSTGFGEIDLQHKKLINIIGNINTSMQAPEKEYQLLMAKAIKQLTDYTQYHFSEEEKFMRLYDYPDSDKHKKEHEAFIAKVHIQITTLTKTNPEFGYQFYRFLGHWLLTHIAKEDQAWAEYIRKAQVKK